MNGDEPRRTERATAGIKPVRYGDPVDGTGQNTRLVRDPSIVAQDRQSIGNENFVPSSNSSRSIANRCSRSASSLFSTHSSTVRETEVDLDLAEQIAALEECHDEKLRSHRLLEFEVKSLVDKIEYLKRADVVGADPDTIQQQRSDIEVAERDLKSKSAEIERSKVNLEFDEKSLKRKQDLLRKKADLDKLRIEDEDDSLSQDLSDDEEVRNQTIFANEQNELLKRVTEEKERLARALTAAQRARLASPPKTHEDPAAQRSDEQVGLYSEEDARLLERFQHLQGPTAPPAATIVRNKALQNHDSPQNIDSNFPTPSDGPDRLVDTLRRALERIPRSSSDNTTEKFLARQVHGKDLPQFSGRAEEWIPFITCYRTTTATCKYDDNDNLVRLQKCLRDEAMKTVQCLMSTPDNVKEIMHILEVRFGQPDHIVDSLVDKARNLPNFKDDRLDCLIDFGLAVKNLTATMIALNCLDHMNNPTLLKELEQKLPVSLRMGWMTWLSDDNLRKKDLKTFCTWMDRQTNAACKLCPPKVKLTERDNRKPNQGGWRDRKREDRVLVATDEETPPKKTKQCADRTCTFCKKPGHRVSQCRAFIKLNIDERWKWVRENRHCFGCLIYGHSVINCNSKKTCGKDDCKRFHNPLVHKDIKPEQPETVGHAVKSGHTSSHVHMMIVPVLLKGPKKTISTLAMLDPGASISLIDTEISNSLGLVGVRKPLSYRGLHPTVNVVDSSSVDLEIITADGKKTHVLSNVRTINYLPLPQQSLRRSLLSKWSHLRDINIQAYDLGIPKILIGLDHVDLIMSREYITGPPNSPSAARTELGWVLCGKTNEIHRNEMAFIIQDEEQDSLHQLVKQHFTTEAFGVKVIDEKPRSREDKSAQVIMDNTIKRVGQQWESGLLWKQEDVRLPSSKGMALSRLFQMERKMDRDSEFASQYSDKIQEYVNKGFARKLTPEEAKQNNARTFYLPHFMSRNPKKPKKLRFVFDAAAKVNGISLNDNLLIGPDQLTSMPSVLFKFRQRKIGITADIEDMFHRIRVRKEDSSAQRFLWRGMSRNTDPATYEMGVLIFGASCSPACAQEAKNRNALEFKDQYPESVKAILERHYVDDYLDSCDSVKEAVTRLREICEIHSQGSFRICKWVTNSSEVLNMIPPDLRAHQIKSIAESHDQMERVLGLFWRPEDDIFTFTTTFLKTKGDILNVEKVPTKREVLALVMSVYDPLGFLSLFTVRGKMILQEIWRSRIGWDDEVSGTALDKWKLWIQELKGIESVQIPRCYSSHFSSSSNIQLHVFCDATEQAFGAVAYYRVQVGRLIHIALVMSKARVAPLKSLSIPRMELQAAVLGSRLGKFIQEEHEIKVNKTVYWSDNQTVLCWLRSDSKRYKQFVGHRIGEIQEITNPADWKWIPTQHNVADELTRNNKSCDWSQTSRWVNGPDFLTRPESEWPVEKSKTQPSSEEEVEDEMKKECIHFMKTTDPVISVGKYSSLNRLLRVTAYVFRIIKYCLANENDRREQSGSLLPSHVSEAESWWWRRSQEDSFREDIHLIRTKKELPNSSRLLKLSVFMDTSGILRIRGRIERAPGVSYAVKYPVVLDPKHQFTKLMIMHYHVIGGHHGMERVVNEIRQKYYVINLRAAVKSSWSSCQRCRNYRARPAIPEMAPLPDIRLRSHVRPFTISGLDYFGPVEVTVGRRREKRYGAIFTCLSTRAIHLEIANSLTSDSCIMAIRRFVGRRGCPVEIWSDNGTNFKGANNELKLALKAINQDKLTNECTNRGIVWKFIPPAAPHMGGSWERMVRSVKIALHATLKERAPSDELLHTLIVEAEHIVNCHPLTHVPLHPEDLEALTPNHFLIGSSSNVQVPGVFPEEDLCLRNKWRRAQGLANMFWSRWVREYLPTLLRRTKWFRNSKSIELGDIVVEVNQHLERNSWPIGRVVRLYSGPDELIRAVDVQFSTGVLKRPVSKLCVLDVRKSEKLSDNAATDIDVDVAGEV